MGCNADKNMRNDVPCSHRRVLECQDCRCTFAVRYTDDVIQSLLDRVKELESKLGAATSGVVPVVAADPSARNTTAIGITPQAEESASVPPAAPSVSAVVWRGRAMAYRDDGYKSAADACDLAAAVAAFCEREWSNKGLDQAWDLNRLGEIALAFVRGEPLPQKGG